MGMREILHQDAGDVLFSGEFDSLKACVEAAVSAGAVLRGADLRDADLRDAVLRGAVLRGADLRGAEGVYTFGPIGSAGRICFVCQRNKQLYVLAGCFDGTLDEFEARVREKHGGNLHGRQYLHQIEAIRKMAADGCLWWSGSCDA